MTRQYFIRAPDPDRGETLQTCPICHKETKESDKSCPGCGYKFPAKYPAFQNFIMILLSVSRALLIQLPGKILFFYRDGEKSVHLFLPHTTKRIYQSV